MDYNDIPVFIRVVETSSFTKAASMLGVQKSSVSRSIVRLETELGVRLLQRTTRQLGLTDAGHAFYERVRGPLTGFDEAAAAVRELGTEPRGTIRLTAPPGSAAIGLAGAIASFVRQYPAITVDLDMSMRTVDLVSEGFDLALRAGKLADSSLIAKKIGTTDLALFAAPSYLKRRGRPRTVRELAEHDCVLFRGRNGRESWRLSSNASSDAGEEVVEVQGRMSSAEIELNLRAAIAGAGIVALAPAHARPAFERGELEVVLSGYHVRGSDLHVVLPSSSFVPTRVLLLRDHLVRELSAAASAAAAECQAHKHNPPKPAAKRVPRAKRK